VSIVDITVGWGCQSKNSVRRSMIQNDVRLAAQCSVRVPWDYFPQIFVRNGELQARPRLELADVLAVELLPRRIVPEGDGFQFSATSCDLVVTQEYINPAIA